MWAVVGHALAARWGHAVIVAMVGLLACVAVAAAPWYAMAATQRVGVAAAEGVAAEERLISAVWEPDQPLPMDPRSEFRERFEPVDFISVVGGLAPGDLRRAGSDGASIAVSIAYREDVCDHLAVTGSCPSAADEVVLPVSTADGLGLSVGDEMEVEHFEDDGENTVQSVVALVRLVGVYHVSDPGDPYWGDGSLVGLGPSSDERVAAFTVFEALGDYQRVSYTYDLVAVPQAFATVDLGHFRTMLDAGIAELQRQEYEVSTGGLDALVDRIARDRENVTTGVGVGVVVLLLLTWFTLVVVLREAVVQVRGDVGWWRLQGAPSGRGWILVAGQSMVPLVGGGAIGAGVGLGVGRALAGPVEGDAGRTALLLALALVALTVAGGLVAVVAAQIGILRTPVRDLLRQIPARRSRWRRSLVDLVLVVLAAAAVGQAFVVADDVVGLASLAPGLAVLAMALIAAWAVQPLAAWLTRRALHVGRLAVALVAASVARRPGTHRLFALAAVAVALVTTAFVGWDSAARAQWGRAALETGAGRVITVAARDSAELLAAVRAVDPTGAEAMAAVHRPGNRDQPPTLAVDSTRLGVVAGWRKEYGGDVDEVAAALRPAAPEPVVVATDRVELEAAGIDPAGATVNVRVQLRTVDSGEAVEALVGPLTDEPGAYPADVPACAAGCRLVGVQLLGPSQSEAAGDSPDADTVTEGAVGEYGPLNAGARVEVFRVAGADGTEVQPAILTEPTRWRPALGPRDLGPAITTGDAALRLTVPRSSQGVPLDRYDWAFVADTPAPLPALVAGWQPDSTEQVRLSPLGVAVPAEVTAPASLVPLFGEIGAVVDLEYAERLAPFAVAGHTPHVWLSSSAPASILDDLREAGLTPLREESLSGNLERLGAEGSAVGVRFQAVVAVVGLLLAGGAVLGHAAQERRGRAAELAALRAQGVDPRVVRVVGYGGLAAVIGAAAVVGVVAGIVGAGIARVLHPGFVDGWAVLPSPTIHPYPVGGAAAIVVMVLGTAVLIAGLGLVRHTDSASGGGLRSGRAVSESRSA